MKNNSVWQFTFDWMILACAVLLGYAFSPSFKGDVLEVFSGGVFFWKVSFVALCMTGGIRIFDVRIKLASGDLIANTGAIIAGLAIGVLFFQVIYALSTATLIDRYAHLIALLAGTILIAAARAIALVVRRSFGRSVLFVGSRAQFTQFAQAIGDRGDLGIRSAAAHFIDSDLDATRTSPGHVVVSPEKLLSYCLDNGVHQIILEVKGELPPALYEALMSCLANGVETTELTVFYETHFEFAHTKTLDDRWFWGHSSDAHDIKFQLFKRIFDIVAASVGLVFAVPIIAAAAVAIRVSCGSPVIYRQVRVGRYNRTFTILKLRTMALNAEAGGAVWAKQNDSRVTKVGTILRRTRLDELPQLVNVLLGDMSLIGPRPERPEMVEKIAPMVRYYNYRHLVKPGLSGWAQVSFPYGASIEDAEKKLAYDLYYIKYASVFLDLRIALKTLAAMVKGAR